MAGAAGGGGGGAPPMPSSTSGGELLLQLLQKPQQSQLEPPVNSAAAAASNPYHDPAVAAMGPSLPLHHPWPPQPPNHHHPPLYPSNSFLHGFNPNPWAHHHLPHNSSFAANPLFFTDEFQQIGHSGINGRHQQQEQKKENIKQENMLMFGSLACELGSSEGLQNRSFSGRESERVDKAMEFNVQKVLQVTEVNGRVDGLEIGANSGWNWEFDRGVNSGGPTSHQWSHRGGREGGGEWERRRHYAPLERSDLQEPRRAPPGFTQRPKGVDQWGSVNRWREIERNVGKERIGEDTLNRHIHTFEAPKLGGIEENGFSRLGLIKQLDHPGPPMGSNLHSVPASDIEESLASVHGEVNKGSGRNELTREEGRSGDEAVGLVHETQNHLEGEDFPEHFADSLVLSDGLGKKDVGRRHSDSFNKVNDPFLFC